MNQLSIDFTPREIGRAAADSCLRNAEEIADFDSAGAAKFIHGWVIRNGPTSGEDLVDAAMTHGYRGHDMRCFGGVFVSLVSKGRCRSLV